MDSEHPWAAPRSLAGNARTVQAENPVAQDHERFWDTNGNLLHCRILHDNPVGMGIFIPLPATRPSAAYMRIGRHGEGGHRHGTHGSHSCQPRSRSSVHGYPMCGRMHSERASMAAPHSLAGSASATQAVRQAGPMTKQCC